MWYPNPTPIDARLLCGWCRWNVFCIFPYHQSWIVLTQQFVHSRVHPQRRPSKECVGFEWKPLWQGNRFSSVSLAFSWQSQKSTCCDLSLLTETIFDSLYLTFNCTLKQAGRGSSGKSFVSVCGGQQNKIPWTAQRPQSAAPKGNTTIYPLSMF